MNPSASGWLTKCLQRINTTDILSLDELQFYNTLRSTGFIYGSNQSALIPLDNKLNYTQEELSKINLFVALVYVDYQLHGEEITENTLARLLSFYGVLHSEKEFFSSILKFKTKTEHKLEQIIHKRVQTNEGLIQKNFSHLITNALLFTDVITFRETISSSVHASDYAKSVEELIMNTVYNALDQKTNKGNYDLLVLKLIKSSLRYYKAKADKTFLTKEIDYKGVLNNFGRFYLFDLACMAVYSDEEIELNELSFMTSFGKELQLKESQINASIEFLFKFVSEYRKNIAYFHFSNPLNHFYKKNQRAVKLLLTRNKKRLLKEITQSKELVYLISQSTHRNLNIEEKLKVKQQLYDIFKSIPSLAIFVLPGGSVLLPIIIKFIPQLLPSAFNENLEDD